MSERLYHTTVQTNGISLPVVQAGARDGKLVILLHGFPEYWGIWCPQIEFLAQKGYCVWVPTQRGYGTAPKPHATADYELDTLAHDIVGLIDAAGREKAIVVAHDWGSMVAWWLGIKHAERIERLALFNAPHPYVFLDHFKNNPRVQKAAGYVNFFRRRGIAEFVLSLFDYAIPTSTMRKGVQPDLFSDVVLAEYKSQWRQHGAFSAMLEWYRALFEVPPKPASLRVPVPTLLVMGGQDAWMLPEMAKPSIDICDQGTLHVWDDSTHWTVQELPERVNKTLGKWLGV